MVKEKIFNLRLFCKNVTLDDRTKDYIIKRFKKMEKFLKRSLEYELEISMDKKGQFRAEMMIQTPYRLYRTEEISESVEGSVDMAVDQMQQQIVRDADKIRDLRKRGARSIKKRIVVDKKARFGR